MGFRGLETDRRFCSRVCNEVGCVVVDVDYRLAPEFPWPTQLQDSWAALLWVCSLFKYSHASPIILLPLPLFSRTNIPL